MQWIRSESMIFEEGSPYGINKVIVLIYARAILGLLYCISLSVFRRILVMRLADKRIHIAYLVLLFGQFHAPFYASRPLPNTFSSIPMNLAFAAYVYGMLNSADLQGNSVEEDHKKRTRSLRLMIWILSFACIVFRCDMVLLSITLIFTSVLTKKLSVNDIFVTGCISSILWIGLTVAVDSYYWGRLCWPEFDVLFFNTAENRSHEWGVSPFHFYFTSALPRALLISLMFIPFGCLRMLPSFAAIKTLKHRAIQRSLINWNPLLLLFPAVVFVVIYSFLPHKELRFIFPSFPLFTAVAAVGLVRLYGLAPNLLIKVFLVSSLLVSVVASLFFLWVSSLNYPGGQAMEQFHRLYQQHHSYHLHDNHNTNVKPILHIDNLAAISGVSRFGEHNQLLRYSKREHLNLEDYGKLGFDYLINSSPHVPGYERFPNTSLVIAGLHRVDILHGQIELKPMLFFHKRV
jgi:alpha-1,6-mannosyltransferase